MIKYLYNIKELMDALNRVYKAMVMCIHWWPWSCIYPWHESYLNGYFAFRKRLPLTDIFPSLFVTSNFTECISSFAIWLIKCSTDFNFYKNCCSQRTHWELLYYINNKSRSSPLIWLVKNKSEKNHSME